MDVHNLERLRSIRTFPSLVKYLREELDWPVESDDFDDLTFDYEPEELGLEPKIAVKIKEIKQLRPFITDQPWGIFFINFEPKRLPVVVLRRVLRALVIKKRQSLSKADQKFWKLHDLMFVSSYGESEDRSITFAHFSDSDNSGLPTLKVIGWDYQDTPLHLDQCAKELEKLKFSEDLSSDDWRKQWSSAFSLEHREVITTSKALAERMAVLATKIRRRVNSVLKIESQNGPIRKLYKAFQETLIHDLSEDDFADMYAQTITYGLFSARCSREASFVADNLADMVPVTNPFLKDLLATFLTIGGRKGKIDFDELGINDVVQMLRDANMEAVKRDFDDKNPEHDPVIHFYELFLKQYDAKKKTQRGVFYTPKPVVSFIVRSVDEILHKEFGLEDGLADTTTWGEMLLKHPDMKLPTISVKNPKTLKMEDVPISKNEPFVKILDPATGTATFLVEVIDVIHKTMLKKWEKEGRMPLEFPTLWNQYVPKHLLPRLYGFELMMAPYAIAHMKIGLKLFETGYKFGSNERARIYLTNSLEPPQDFADTFEQMAPALAHEAQAVNGVKRHQRFTVVIGNPPYAGHSWNLTPELRHIVDPYREICGERVKEKGALQLEKSIQDDYIKFIRLAQIHIDSCGVGILGLVTSHGFLDNPSLRGMRFSILTSFKNLFVLDMHGNMLRHKTCPDGSPDKNVFDIKDTGVAVSIFRKIGKQSSRVVEHSELWGDRYLAKYPWLCRETALKKGSNLVKPREPHFLFIPQDVDCLEEYEKGHSLSEVMPLYSKGVVTGRDAFVIDFDETPLIERMREFAESDKPDNMLVEKFDLNPTDWWHVDKARRQMPASRELSQYIRPILYRPFDTRVCFYHPAVFMSPRRPVMKHMDPGLHNLLLITSRMTKGESFQHITVSRGLAEAILLSSKTSNNAIIFPLYLYAHDDRQDPILGLNEARQPNFTKMFLDMVSKRIGLPVIDGYGDFRKNLGIEDLFDYIVAILHSPSYRTRYEDPLSRDFPRVPLTSSIDLFRGLAKLGEELVSLHLMESDKLNKHITKWLGQTPSSEIEKVIWSDDTVWINKSKTEGFKGVTENFWNFHIGGYQVCEKWLKDRKGRKLSKEDIEHYQKIVVALNETIRIMKEIDEVIAAHGAWPNAFSP